jgi:hypothetical protein
MASVERHSDSAPRIFCSVSSVTRRGLGAGVKVFRQARQRSRAVPPQLVPCLTTDSGHWQNGHEMTDDTMQESLYHPT